jgi:glycosyltransferase involved in cell wall biosynthesis
VYVHNAVKNNSPEIVRLYQQSDVFVLPTRADCTPLVGMESQACGLPVIATSVGGVPEQVDEGVTGFVIAPDNLSELTARLDTFLAHPELAERMGQAARVRALQHFDLATNYARLVQVVQSVQNTK